MWMFVQPIRGGAIPMSPPLTAPTKACSRGWWLRLFVHFEPCLSTVRNNSLWMRFILIVLPSAGTWPMAETLMCLYVCVSSSTAFAVRAVVNIALFVTLPPPLAPPPCFTLCRLCAVRWRPEHGCPCPWNSPAWWAKNAWEVLLQPGEHSPSERLEPHSPHGSRTMP